MNLAIVGLGIIADMAHTYFSSTTAALHTIGIQGALMEPKLKMTRLPALPTAVGMAAVSVIFGLAVSNNMRIAVLDLAGMNVEGRAAEIGRWVQGCMTSAKRTGGAYALSFSTDLS
jgi:hypothetical protein